MESLSPKQVREIKDLYKNVYKQEVVEETGDFDDLFESEEFQSLSDELKENIVNIVGGCCGTKPEHIRLIAEVARNYKPRKI